MEVEQGDDSPVYSQNMGGLLSEKIQSHSNPLIITFGERSVIVKPVPQTLYFLTPEEQSNLPDGVKSRILSAIQEPHQNFHAAVKQITADRNEHERKVYELDMQLSSANSTIKETTSRLEREVETVKGLKERLEAAETKVSNQLQEIMTAKTDGLNIQHDLNVLKSEKQDLSELVEKRELEIQSQAQEIVYLKKELDISVASKIEALAKLDDSLSREIEVEYKEKQLEREQGYMNKQVQLLNDELERKNIEILNIQRESSLKNLNLQTELSEKCEQLRILELSEASNKKHNEEQQKHIERLMGKLSQTQEMENRMEENYKAEIKSLKKVSELYRESTEEGAQKIKDFEKAVESLQSLLKTATEKYGVLENKFLATSKNYQEEIDQRDERILKLEEELNKANELLKNMEKNGLTDEMIKSLSPAAAAATSMLRETTSLTEMFSKYHSIYEQLLIEKDNNAKLNAYMKEILSDIEERAPILRKQKEEYENMEKTLNMLTQRLDLALLENGQVKAEAQQQKKSMEEAERTVHRLRVQSRDLALQVRSLTRECEFLRGGQEDEQDAPSVPDVNDTPAQQAITDNLVLFRNIEELQSQNQRLLAIVRDLSDSQEQAEKQSHEAQMKLIKESFDQAKKELDELRKLREKQENNITHLTEQRDMYAKLLKQEKQSSGSNNADVPLLDPALKQNLEKKVYEWECRYNQLREEFDIYRREKRENEKIASAQMEKLRDDLVRIRSENSKFASQAEFNNEQIKVYNSNLNQYKLNIQVLEERNNAQAATIVKSENAIQNLKNELQATTKKLAQVEVSLASMTQDRNSLRDMKARLEAEKDMMVREQNTQKLIQANIQKLRESIESNGADGKQRLDSRIQQLQEECQILRRKLDSENERFRECVREWNSTSKDLRERSLSDQGKLDEARQKLLDAEDKIRQQNATISDLQSELKTTKESAARFTGQTVYSTSNVGFASSGSDSSNEVVELKEKVEGLERELKTRKKELSEALRKVDSLNNHLELSQKRADEYKQLSESLESQLTTQSQNNKNLTEELSDRLNHKDDLIREIQMKCDGLEKENFSMKDEIKRISEDLQGKNSSLQEELSRMRRELQTGNTKLQNIVEENLRLKGIVDSSLENLNTLQLKYEQEIKNKGVEMEKAQQLRKELEEAEKRESTLSEQKIELETEMTKIRVEFSDKEQKLEEQFETMSNNCTEVEKLNSQLQEQIGLLLKKLEGREGESIPASASDDPQSSEQWLQLVRYLRREKDLAKGKLEVAQTNINKLESQLKYVDAQFQSAQKELKLVQEGSHISMITSAKQAELLRKVETLSALTDSNRLLREEKTLLSQKLEELESKMKAAEMELVPLRQKVADLSLSTDSLETENNSLKADVFRWKQRASELLEKTNKVNPEEMKRIISEKENLIKQIDNSQEINKKTSQEANRLSQQVKSMTVQMVAVTQSNTTLTTDKKKLEQDLKDTQEATEKMKQEINELKRQIEQLKACAEKEQIDLRYAKDELKNALDSLNESRNTVKQVKNIARKYKKHYEDLLNAESGGTATASGIVQAPKSEVTSDAPTLEETDTKSEERLKLETELQQLRSECETLKSEIETMKQDRAMNVVKGLKEKLSTVTQEKSSLEAELGSVKQNLQTYQVSADEHNVRFAALKSQYEGRLSRLEKENKDLKSSISDDHEQEKTPLLTPGGPNDDVNEENQRLKKELLELRQRMALIEKTFKPRAVGTPPQLKLDPEPQQTTSSSGDETGGLAKPTQEKAKANVKPITPNIPTSRAMQTACIRPIHQSSLRPKTTASITPNSAGNQLSQVSTSTPEGANMVSVPTSTNAGTLRQATVPPTVSNVVSVQPQPQIQEPSPALNQQQVHPQPSTSEGDNARAERSENSDSSEQVSSSEPLLATGTIQPMLTVAPIRSNVSQPLAPEAQENIVNEEQPSSTPSSSRQQSQQRPSQSTQLKKRPRSVLNEVETSGSTNETEDDMNASTEVQPVIKKPKTAGAATVIEREAEATRTAEDMETEDMSPGSVSQEDETPQVSNTTGQRESASDGLNRNQAFQETHGDEGGSDSDVIVIESDDEEENAAENEEPEVRSDEDDEPDEEDDEEDDNMEEFAEEEDEDEEEDEERDELIDEDDEDIEVQEDPAYEAGDEGREAESRESSDQQQHALSELNEDNEDNEEPGQSQNPETDPSLIQTSQEDEINTTSSTSTIRGRSRQSRGPQQISPYPGSMSYQSPSESDDGIVPSTPTLYVPRRADGFAEAVNSARNIEELRQAPTAPAALQFQPPRFTFTPPSENTSSGGTPESVAEPPSNVGPMEDTRLDLVQFDSEGTGRSVPSTPLQQSPPAEAGMITGEVTNQDPTAASDDIQQQQPSSSAEQDNAEESTPTITGIRTLTQEKQEEDEANKNANQEGEVESAGESLMTSVTSSDEDKLSTNFGKRGGASPSSSGNNNPPSVPRARPTPIVWDQPSSSSNNQAQGQAASSSGLSQYPPRLTSNRGARMRGGPPGQMMPSQSGVMSSRGLYNRQQMTRLPGNTRGSVARRSRPHSRGPTRGVGGPPFQKPYP